MKATDGNGRTWQGTAYEVVREMMGDYHGVELGTVENPITVGQYITECVRYADRDLNVKLDVRGRTECERASSYMNELALAGLMEVEYEHVVITDEDDDGARLEATLTRLETIKQEIHDLLDEAKDLITDTDEAAGRRAESYWIAHIIMALSDDHTYLGGSMVTMQGSIDELRDGDEEEYEEEEEEGR